ncbi:MAG: hypothetical protein J5802_00555 [Butyrivibrio sp.]|nr:hypothetical protein [Butyrivibrio sp.]
MNKRSVLGLMLVLLMSSAVGCGKSDVNIEAGEGSTSAETSVEAVTGASDESAEAGSAGALDITGDDLSNLYNEAKECQNAAKFEGEWHSGEHSSFSGDIAITEQSAKGFHFSGFFNYYLHTGEAEGDALFVNDNVAVYKYTESEGEFLGFYMDGDTLHVIQKGLLGMGLNVTAEGEYTQDKQEFKNEDILNKAYTESQLSEIQKLIGDDELYEDYFKYGTEIGAVSYNDTETKDGEKCRFVHCLVPTYGTEYSAVLMDDGRIYLRLKVSDMNSTSDKLYTNDPEYTGEDVPETVKG